MKNKIVVLIFLVLFLFIFAGCGEKQKYYAGENVSPDDIARYSESIFTEENQPNEETLPENITTTDDIITTTENRALNTLEMDMKNPESDPIIDAQIYYWTPSGKKYHVFSDCGYLSNSDNVLSGTLEEGMAVGKSGLCKTCEKKLNSN